MKWTVLNALEETPWHSEPTAAKREELNARIGKLIERRAGCDRLAATLANDDLATIDPNRVFQSDCPAQNRFELLQQELRTRNELAAFYPMEAADRRAEAETAQAKALDQRTEIENRLLAMGYYPNQTPAVRGMIFPGYINDHPAVVEAEAYWQSLRYDVQPSPRKLNEDAIAAIRREMDAMRRGAL